MKKLIIAAISLITLSSHASTIDCKIKYQDQANGSEEEVIEIKDIFSNLKSESKRLVNIPVGNFDISAVQATKGKIYSLSITDRKTNYLIFPESINTPSSSKSVGAQNLNNGGEAIHVRCYNN